ncbi:GNAT family N-acetyltransferase [Actinophytocola sp. KF-1]
MTADRPTVSLDDAPLLQARNSAAFWAATGTARGDRVVRARGYLAVVGGARNGTRVLIQEPDLDAAEIAEITALVRQAAGPVDLEDPYSATDLGLLGLRDWQMPVMLREPGPAPAPALDVVRALDEADLVAAERIVIDSFGLTRFQPPRPGDLFPPGLVERGDAAVHLALVDAQPAGACVSLLADGVGSHYWVGTTEAFRSRGVGRAVMLASIQQLRDHRLTLTASRLGRPLYESLGYAVAGMSTWYSST